MVATSPVRKQFGVYCRKVSRSKPITICLVVLAIASVASYVYGSLQQPPKEQPPQVAHAPSKHSPQSEKTQEWQEPDATVTPEERVSQDLLMDQDLIAFAGRRTYSHSRRRRQLEMLRSWCNRNAGARYLELDAAKKRAVLDQLQSGLDDLLAERDFEHRK